MSITMQMRHKVELNAPLITRNLPGVLQEGDTDANAFVLEVTQDGNPFDLSGYTPSGYLIRGDGNSVLLDGTVENNIATIPLSPACYRVPGFFAAFVRLTNVDGVSRTVLKVTGTVAEENLGGIVDDENILPSIDELLAQLDALEAAREEALEAAQTANAAAESAAEAASGIDAKVEAANAELKSALPSTYVALAGENQVTPQNIAGMQFTKTEGTVDGENIFSADMLWREGHYVIVDDGTVSVGGNASCNAYCVPVEQNSTYVFPECRFAVLATGNTFGSPAIGDTLQYPTQADTGEATYLFLSYTDTPVGDITVKKKENAVVYTNFILPDWLNQKPVKKPKSKSVSGSLSDGSALIVQGCRNNIRKGERVVFYGNITSFNSISIGISISETSMSAGVMNTFAIDGTNITYTENQYSTPVVIAHGLTIADNIQIIGEETATGTYKITIVSDGYLFMHEFNYSQRVIGAPYVSSAGSVITDAKLTWTCTDLDRQIWMFGDSYFAYSPERWTYYLHEYGYDKNCLLDGWPGMGSTNARVSFSNLLAYGTPRFAVWCMGMNDGGDSGATPSTDWSTQRDIFLQYCNENEVTPVFATIPTVPSVNNEAKNAWVRSSGYRYIDFSLAVGASSSGTWYSGMLSSDNVHPTEKGAKALFARFLVDFPEIMVTE